MTGKLANLQALRGAACLAVVLYHAGVWEKNVTFAPKPFFRAFTHAGFAGVDLFFVVSGFILTWINWKHLGRPRHLPAHLLKRAWRVFPLFWVAWAAMLGCFVWVVDRPLAMLTGELPHALLLVPPPGSDMYVVVPHGWTLAFEVMFYAAFAAVFLVPRRWAVPLGCAWAGACGWHAATHALGNGTLTTDYALRPFVLEFLAGCAVAGAIRHGFTRGANVATIAGVLWFLAAWALEGFRVTSAATSVTQRVLLFGPAAALLVYGLVAREHTTGRTLPRWLQRTGDASYSIYLFHYPVLFAVTFLTFHWGHRTKPHLAWAVLVVAGGVGLGFLMHHFVERPLLALPGWLRRIRSGDTDNSRTLHTARVVVRPSRGIHPLPGPRSVSQPAMSAVTTRGDPPHPLLRSDLPHQGGGEKHGSPSS